MGREISQQSEIRKLQNLREAERCARMMTDSEPWRTLRQAYGVSLEIVIDPSREIYLAWVDGEVAGFVIFHMDGVFNGYVQAVCVALEWRNRGIGSQLLRFAEERIFRETPDAFLCVSSLSRDALRLYKRLGYEVIDELRDSEILLRKRMGLRKPFDLY